MTLCNALPAVFAEFSDTHCIFAGGIEDGAEGKMADCLNACIEHNITDRVHFIGARGDVPDILAELDVFVFSSLYEGLPVAVAEAMLAGVPMIVSEIAPLLEATSDGEFAETFPVKDASTLSGKLVGLLSSEEKRKELSRKALAHANDNFSITAHLRDLKKVYQKVLDA